MPRTPEQFEEIRKEKRLLIKKTALQLFAENGYENSTISNIAQTAGISKGLLYNYFKSKEELLQEIIVDINEEFGNMLDPDHDGEITDDEASGFLDTFFDIVMHRREEMKLYYQLSFQHQVMDVLHGQFGLFSTEERQQMIVAYFRKKFPTLSSLTALFTIAVYLRGIVMMYIQSHEMFSEEFMMKYKNELKEQLGCNVFSTAPQQLS